MTECKNKWHYQPHPDVKRCPDCNEGREPGETYHFYPKYPLNRLSVNLGPYRTPGENEVPRPIEIPFRVSVFVEGGSTKALDSREKLAEDFEEYLGSVMLDPDNQAEMSGHQVLAVEVKAKDDKMECDHCGARVAKSDLKMVPANATCLFNNVCTPCRTKLGWTDKKLEEHWAKWRRVFNDD